MYLAGLGVDNIHIWWWSKHQGDDDQDFKIFVAKVHWPSLLRMDFAHFAHFAHLPLLALRMSNYHGIFDDIYWVRGKVGRIAFVSSQYVPAYNILTLYTPDIIQTIYPYFVLYFGIFIASNYPSILKWSSWKPHLEVGRESVRTRLKNNIQARVILHNVRDPNFSPNNFLNF